MCFLSVMKSRQVLQELGSFYAMSGLVSSRTWSYSGKQFPVECIPSHACLDGKTSCSRSNLGLTAPHMAAIHLAVLSQYAPSRSSSRRRWSSEQRHLVRYSEMASEISTAQ